MTPDKANPRYANVKMFRKCGKSGLICLTARSGGMHGHDKMRRVFFAYLLALRARPYLHENSHTCNEEKPALTILISLASRSMGKE